MQAFQSPGGAAQSRAGAPSPREVGRTEQGGETLFLERKLRQVMRLELWTTAPCGRGLRAGPDPRATMPTVSPVPRSPLGQSANRRWADSAGGRLRQPQLQGEEGARQGGTPTSQGSRGSRRCCVLRQHGFAFSFQWEKHAGQVSAPMSRQRG